MMMMMMMMIPADRVREGDRGEGADEDDGASFMDALGEILRNIIHHHC